MEGFNGKLRMITRRACGFHSHQAQIGMIFLTCGGIQLEHAYSLEVEDSQCFSSSSP